MRGIAGHPADTDRDIGFKNVLKDYPGHQGRPERRRRRHRTGTRRRPPSSTNDFISSGQYDNDPGHLDLRHGLAGRRRHQGRRQAVRADRRRRPRRVRQPAARPDGLSRPEGAAVTNTAAVGGAGVNLALKLLNGETVDDRPVGAASPTPSSSCRSSPTTPPTRARPLQSWQVDPGSTRSGRSASRSRAGPRTRRSRPSPARARASSPIPRQHRRGMPASPASPDASSPARDR